MRYWMIFLVAGLVAWLVAWLVRGWARKQGIMDDPASAPERKIQSKPIPLLGGWAVIAATVAVGLGVYFLTDWWSAASFGPGKLVGILVGALILALGGFLDDKYDLKPKWQIVFPILAVLAVVFGGVDVGFVTNPLGGIIYLPGWLSMGVTIVWLMVMIYTVKFLDGLDGLATGISGIGGLAVAGLCLVTAFWQPEVAILALIFAGACVGFLIWNFYPAKIFLGESGSLFGGFMLGVLAIISGSKIATTLLVLGVPLLDLIWVIGRRIFKERKSPFQGDRLHLHFRLLDAGLSQRQAVLFLYGWAVLFGAAALFLQSWQKVAALAVLLAGMGVMGVWTARRARMGEVK